MNASRRLKADLIYDIGMHKGEDSAYYLAKGYRVVGFEAHPDLVAHCRERFKGEARLTIVEGAIAEGDKETVRFYVHPNSVWGTTSEAWADRPIHEGQSKPIDVRTVDLAATLRETGIPVYMKIDVEGADRFCLQTLLEFDERPEFVSIEASHTDPRGVREEFDLLEELGYNRFAVVQQETIGGSEIETQTLNGEPLRYHFEPESSGAFGADLAGWSDRGSAEKRYRRVHRIDRLARAPYAILKKSRIGRKIRGRANRVLGPMPGWFDTHAGR